MTDPKPVKMWMVYDHENKPRGYTTCTLRRDAIEALIFGDTDIRNIHEDWPSTWSEYKAWGYTVRRVTITPDHESEK